MALILLHPSLLPTLTPACARNGRRYQQKADGAIWAKVTSLVAPGSVAAQYGMKVLGMKDPVCVSLLLPLLRSESER